MSIQDFLMILSSAHEPAHTGTTETGEHETQNFGPEDNLYRDEHAAHSQAFMIYLVSLGILLGLILREINKKLGQIQNLSSIPYSPMVLTCGLILAIIAKHMGTLGASIYSLSHLHPHIIVFIFIPVLLFESAFNCDWYIFRGQMVNILILAGPGVAWGAILLGCVFKFILMYGDGDMTLFQAFTLGSVLSATDPVAVVALLKELGASSRFNHLIEGEALLNDGVAMVFFLVFNALSKAQAGTGDPISIFGILTLFCRLSIVGPLLGIIIAFFAAQWARRIVGDDVEVSWLTFVVAYLTFFWAEFTFFHTSGLLAVVCLGLFWSAFGKTKIRHESEHAVHTVWAFVQYSCDTIIYLIVGFIVATDIMEEDYIHGMDWLKMFIFFILMIIARWVMIISFWPILKRNGYPISRAELIVMVYGGLRGALGLTLSLMVGCDQALPARFRHLSVFYTAGMATLTTLVNGTTAKSLVEYLEMIEKPVIKMKVYKTYLKNMVLEADHQQKELAEDEYLMMADWNQVKNLVGYTELLNQVHTIEQEMKEITGGQYGTKTSYEGVGDSETFGEIRYRVYRLLKGFYFHKFEHGSCEEDTCRLLVESSDVGLDATQQMLNVWELLFISFGSFSTIKYFFKFKESFFIGRIAQYYITKHLGFIYDATTTFIQCATETAELIHHLPLNKTALKVIEEELRAEITKGELYLGSLSDTFPEIIRAIQTRRAAHALLEAQRHYLEHTQQEGLVDDKEFQQMKKDIDNRLIKLENHVFNWDLPSFNAYAMEFPIFNNLPKDEMDQIINSTYEKKYSADEIIYERGMTCQNVYIVQRGNVIEELGDCKLKKALGSLLSYANIIGDGKCQSTARTTTECVVSSLNLNVIKGIMAKNPEFESRLYINAMEYLVKMYRCGPLSNMDSKRLTEFMRNKAKFRKFDQNARVEFMQGGFIFKGEISYQSERLREYSYIPSRVEEFRVLQPLICLVFDEDVTAQRHDIHIQDDEDVHQRFSQRMSGHYQ